MDKKNRNQLMQSYNEIIHKNKGIYKAEAWANLVSSISFTLFLIPFLAKMFILSGKVGNFFISSEKAREVAITVSDFLPYLNANIESWQFLLYTLIFLFVIPITAGAIVYIVIRSIESKKKATPILHSVYGNVENLKSKFRYNREARKPYKGCVFYVAIITILVLEIALTVYDIIVNGSSQSYFIYTLVGFIPITVFVLAANIIFFGAPAALVSGLLFFIQNTTILSGGKRQRIYRQAKDDFEKLAEEFDKEREEEKARKQQEAIAEKRRIKKEARDKQAKEAEQEFALLEDPEKDKKTVKRLADKGSPSACWYMGKMIYQEAVNDKKTKAEKQVTARQAEQYLKIPVEQNNAEAKCLMLSLKVMFNANDLGEWNALLKQARVLKKDKSLPESYQVPLDTMIDTLIIAINGYEKLLSDKKTYTSTSYTSPTYTNTANTLKSSIYYDFLTGEKLYENEAGEVVDKNGNKVPRSRWD